eukprot:TRINITY_DN918_c0_g1_i2.p1 TRINITY_DN918_c0_g1~~TRINITY_DN918_c0_g1_i2.p1  ORF type:complete len:292 (-),score=37.64 TRINITY_DN918_c0_g1_i2:685-1560(-)
MATDEPLLTSTEQRSKTKVHFTWKFVLLLGIALVTVMLTGYAVAVVQAVIAGELKGEIENFHSENDKLKQENEKFEENNIDMEEELDNLTLVNSDLQKQAKTFAQENAIFLEQVERLNSTNAKLINQIDKLANFTLLLHRKVDNLQNKSVQLQTIVQELQNDTQIYELDLQEFAWLRTQMESHANETAQTLNKVVSTTANLFANMAALKYNNTVLVLFQIANTVEKTNNQQGFTEREYNNFLALIRDVVNMTLNELQEKYPFDKVSGGASVADYSEIGKVIEDILNGMQPN